jgi:hypothetical protein
MLQINWPVFAHSPYDVTLCFPLTAETIFYIEKHRQTDLAAQLKIAIQVAIKEDLPTTNPGVTRPVIRDFGYSQAHQYFDIAHSLWVNKILPDLGYNAGALLKLPAASILLPKEYDLARQEILQAHKYFKDNDYDKTVGHCRCALDSIRSYFPHDKPGQQSKTRLAWLRQQDPDTYEYIKVIMHAIHAVGNPTHHARNAPSTGNFGRNEAITVLNITTNIIAYFGSLCPST